jgi:hypothetical protein
MAEQRKFEKSLEIVNPIDTNLSINKEAYVLRILNAQYVNHCFDGCFIIKIDRILKISACTIITTNLKGHGNINVRFIATVRAFKVGEFLCGGSIVKTTPYIFGNYREFIDDCKISATFAIPQGINIAPLPLEKSLRTLRDSQNIPMRIIDVNHKCAESKVAIVVTLLVCHNKYNKYIITNPLTEFAMSNIRPILDEIRYELDLRNNIINGEDADIKKNILFFESLLYSIRYNLPIQCDSAIEIESSGYSKWWGLPPIETPIEAPIETPNDKLINLLELFESSTLPDVVGCVWSRPLNIFKSSPMAMCRQISSTDSYLEDSIDESSTASSSSSSKQKKHFEILEEGNSDTVFIRFFKDMLDYLQIIRKMSEFYSDEAMIMAHKNIWDAMKDVQVII